MAAYFSYLPNIYVGTSTTTNTKQEYTVVKNIFRRVKAREDLSKYTEFFEQISIEDGQMPFQIAEAYYGDPELDWVVLLTNNIIDIYSEWPKSRRELEYYTAEKYDAVDGVHHWETNEIKWNNRVMVEEGIEVDESFEYTLPDGVIIKGSSARFPVSNWEYEYFQNELKRNIYVTMPNALEAFIDEFEELIGYEPNTEVDENGVKKTNISIADKFLTKGSGGGIGRQYSSTYTGTGRVATNLSVSGSTGSNVNVITVDQTVQSDASTGVQVADDTGTSSGAESSTSSSGSSSSSSSSSSSGSGGGGGYGY
jgi:hypothetical protein